MAFMTHCAKFSKALSLMQAIANLVFCYYYYSCLRNVDKP